VVSENPAGVWKLKQIGRSSIVSSSFSPDTRVMMTTSRAGVLVGTFYRGISASALARWGA
jgi:hypothetical protein